MHPTEFDAIISRLQNMQPFNIHSIDENTGLNFPWYQVTGEIINQVIISQENLQVQAELISGQIAQWGRFRAVTKRVWEIEERRYRQWRDQFKLNALNPEGKPEGWKKPSKEALECMYRTHPEYNEWYQKIERAEEAFNSACAIQEAFRAKKEMMKEGKYRRSEEGITEYTIS
jgi:hypothetical protein